eukprot:2322339-Rhodomonas_salina.3
MFDLSSRSAALRVVVSGGARVISVVWQRSTAAAHPSHGSKHATSRTHFVFIPITGQHEVPLMRVAAHSLSRKLLDFSDSEVQKSTSDSCGATSRRTSRPLAGSSHFRCRASTASRLKSDSVSRLSFKVDPTSTFDGQEGHLKADMTLSGSTSMKVGSYLKDH